MAAAGRWIAKLFDAFEEIARHAGHRQEELTGCPLLFWTVGAYPIIYRAAEQKDRAVRK
jgi:hypothetical protein